MTEILCDADQDDEKERGCGRRRRRGQRRRTVTCARVEQPAGVVTEERARGPGAMTSSLHQEQGYGGSESRSAEKVEAAGFLGSATTTPATDTSAPGSGRVNQLPIIFPQPDFSYPFNSDAEACQLYISQCYQMTLPGGKRWKLGKQFNC